MTIDVVMLHRRATELLSEQVEAVTEADLSRPTPCQGWDLRQLMAHQIGQNHGFAETMRGHETPLDAFACIDPVPGAWRASVDEVTTAFASVDPDALVLQPEIKADERYRAGMLMTFHLLDCVIHGWDVAMTLGRDYVPDDDLVAATARVAAGIPDGASRELPSSPFKPSVSDVGSNLWAQTLAMTGRDPHDW